LCLNLPPQATGFPFSGELEGFLRLRVGDHRVFFQETADSLTIHRVRDRKDAYR
jgi:mRNA-degrading endonuclease RelE of RelBE toxin-antitoxin system